MSAADKLREEGRREGRLAGRLEGGRDLLARLAARRFGTLPNKARDRIATVGERGIEAAKEVLLVAQSLDELLAALEVSASDRERQSMSAADRLGQDGSEQGGLFERVFAKIRLEGYQDAYPEGLLEGKRSFIDGVVTLRFGPLPTIAQCRIANADTKAIQAVVEVLLDAQSLDELLVALGDDRLGAEKATLLDVLMDGFEKNEVVGGFHSRDLPCPTESAATERFGVFVAEATRWKGEPVRRTDDVGRQSAQWSDMRILQAGRAVQVLARAPHFDAWWHKSSTGADDPMGPVRARREESGSW